MNNIAKNKHFIVFIPIINDCKFFVKIHKNHYKKMRSNHTLDIPKSNIKITNIYAIIRTTIHRQWLGKVICKTHYLPFI